MAPVRSIFLNMTVTSQYQYLGSSVLKKKKRTELGKKRKENP